jgi:heme/copper-type cytochrome/quinol oxidase subunit 4
MNPWLMILLLAMSFWVAVAASCTSGSWHVALTVLFLVLWFAVALRYFLESARRSER